MAPEKPGVDKKYNEIDQSMPAINDLSQFLKEQNVEFYFALPPSKRMHYHFKLPSHIHTYAQENLNYFLKKLPADVKPIKLMEHFKQNYTNEEIQDMYFKTDKSLEYGRCLLRLPIYNEHNRATIFYI